MVRLERARLVAMGVDDLVVQSVADKNVNPLVHVKFMNPLECWDCRLSRDLQMKWGRGDAPLISANAHTGERSILEKLLTFEV